MIWQDESTPAGAHSRAFRVLQYPRSKAIAQRLGIGEATSAPMCLGCHATPAGQRGGRFQVADGVSCEGCHGAASGWLASHYAVGANHADNVARGLRPLDSPKVRADTCLDCHFGSDDAGQFVNHRIMAAGHPLAARPVLRLRDCAAFPAALPDRSFGARQILDARMAGHSAKLRVALEANSFELLRQFVRHGEAITFQIAIGAPTDDPGLAVRPIDDRDLAHGPLVLGQLKGRTLPVAAAKFAERLAERLDAARMVG